MVLVSDNGSIILLMPAFINVNQNWWVINYDALIWKKNLNDVYAIGPKNTYEQNVLHVNNMQILWEYFTFIFQCHNKLTVKWFNLCQIVH